MTTLWETAGALARGAWRKTSAWRRSSLWMTGRILLTVSPHDVRAVRERARIHEPQPEAARELRSEGDSDDGGGDAPPPHAETCEARISRETFVWNQNNVTRTQAYWNIYQECPELHWALLAHMVSRNGGWSMTDLQGEWLPKLMPARIREAHFELLETCNALIFRDAYPQLKTYVESRRCGAPLFELLPKLGVSSFMLPVWERFWSCRGESVKRREEASALLTVALIVNEQQVVEEPVVQNPYYRDRVLESASYRLQPWLQTNQVVFPLLPPNGRDDGSPKLAGKVLERFADLQERIQFGKCLYGMLFGYPVVRDRVTAFAAEHPHTGSRADYWPQRFCAAPDRSGAALAECPTGPRWHSPALVSAWPDRPLPDLPRRDWFAGDSEGDAYGWLTSPKPPHVFDMTYEHLLGQRKLQAAAQLTDDQA